MESTHLSSCCGLCFCTLRSKHSVLLTIYCFHWIEELIILNVVYFGPQNIVNLYFKGFYQIIFFSGRFLNARDVYEEFTKGGSFVPKCVSLVLQLVGLTGLCGWWMLVISSGMMSYNLNCDAYNFCDESFYALYIAIFWILLSSIILSISFICCAACCASIAICCCDIFD